MQRIDLAGHLLESLALEFVCVLEDQEAEHCQYDRDCEHQHADADDRAGRLRAGLGSVITDDVQANAGQGACNRRSRFHQEGLRRAGNRFIALAEFELAVVDNVSDAAGGGADGQAGAKEDERAGRDYARSAVRGNIAQQEQQHKADDRQPAGQEVNLFAVDRLRDFREAEQANHFRDDRIAEDGVQESVAAGFLEIVDRERFEDLGAEVEGQQQANEGNQLVVLDDDAKRFAQAGLFRLDARAGGRLLLDKEAGDANADNEEHDNRDCDVCKASDRDVQNRAVRLLLYNSVVARHVVKVVDDVQAEGADDEAADRSEDTRDNRDGFALTRVARQVRQPGPVRDVHDCVGHAVQDVHD